MGGLDEVLARPDATVKCTLTPIVCRDPSCTHFSPDPDTEEENNEAEEEDEDEVIFCTDGEEAFPMKPIVETTGAWWSLDWKEQEQELKRADNQDGQPRSFNDLAIPSAISMERSATLPRAST
jgi:hypothetical protein